MTYPELSILVASYNTPLHIQRMLQSFIAIHGDGPFNLIISENSTNDETKNILDKNEIQYIINPGGTHSESVDELLSKCSTRYALLVDSDIVFTQKIDKPLAVMKANGGTVMGEIQGSRGGYNLHPRIAPWFCLIDVHSIKHHGILFHDQTRIDKTGSGYFYKSPPINPNMNNVSPFYDVGATFYEDINKFRLKIIDAKGITKYFNHYEGGSWRRTSGNDGYIQMGNAMHEKFLSETAHLNSISIKGKYNKISKTKPGGNMMTRERYIELFEKWKPQQIKEEFWQFIEYMNTRPPVNRFLEIGTAFGTTIPFFAEMASDLAITVDIRNLQFEHLTDAKVKYIVGDSANVTIIEQIKKHLNGELFDFIFIDGAHEYPAVKRDYDIYKNFVRKGGILAFHDVVILPEVRRFWDELVPQLPSYQVFYLTDGTGNGIGVIHV